MVTGVKERTKIIGGELMPKPVFCVTSQRHRSQKIADQAICGVFTNAGMTVDVGFPVDWNRTPVPEDEEWRIEWLKFYFGLDMANAFRARGDVRYLESWMRLVSSFIAQQPDDSGTSDVAGRRVLNWVYALTLFSGSNEFPGGFARFADEFLFSLDAQVEFIMNNLTPRRNHRTLELYAIFIAALAFPQLARAPGRLEFALHELSQNLEADFLSDGVHCEQSTHYHLIVLRSFLGVLVNCRRFGIRLPEGFARKVEKACEFGMHIHRPDGWIPAISDSDSGSYRDLLLLASDVFGRNDLRYAATRGLEGEPPADSSVSFNEGGYHIQRSGWGSKRDPFGSQRFLVFDCGPIGEGGHGHYDLLSIELAANGSPLVLDPGRYSYSEKGARNWRHYFKGTAAHNTVCVDGLDQTAYRRGKPKGGVARGVFLERKTRSGLDVLCGQAVSPLYDAVHKRRIFFIRGEYWIVWDRLESVDPHLYELRYHLTPADWNRVMLRNTSGQIAAQTTRAFFVFGGSPKLTVEPGWVSPEYGVKQRVPVLKAVRENVVNTSFFTLISPVEGRTGVPGLEVERDADRTDLLVKNTGISGDTLDKIGFSVQNDRLTGLCFRRIGMAE